MDHNTYQGICSAEQLARYSIAGCIPRNQFREGLVYLETPREQIVDATGRAVESYPPVAHQSADMRQGVKPTDDYGFRWVSAYDWQLTALPAGPGRFSLILAGDGQVLQWNLALLRGLGVIMN